MQTEFDHHSNIHEKVFTVLQGKPFLFHVILPESVSVCAVKKFDPQWKLVGSESEVIANAIEKRVIEFTSGRHCARTALGHFGFPDIEIPQAKTREPIWPMGFVGSITHCLNYCAAAVAPNLNIEAMGIDVEPDEALPPGVLYTIATAQEIQILSKKINCRFSADKLLFSCKESLFKAVFPGLRFRLDFKEVEIVFQGRDSFSAKSSRHNPKLDSFFDRLKGRFVVEKGLVFTAAWVDAVNNIEG